MPKAHLPVAPQVPAELATGIARLQTELEIPPDFPAAVVAEAERIHAGRDFPDHADRTNLGFIAIDPDATLDVDQIVHISRTESGFLVRYGIADLAAWIVPGGEIDQEAQRRGQTLYAPAGRTPLHPPRLSEAAASLLADGKARPAMLWELELDEAGNLQHTQLTRALVVNTRQYSYVEAASALASGEAHETLRLLSEVGQLRQRIEAERGGVSLNLPEQEVVARGDVWSLDFRTLTAIENYNAQISLLTGIAAAEVMLDAKIGIVRTLPAVAPGDLLRLRRIAKTLRVDWPRERGYPSFVRSLDPSLANHLAMMLACMTLFRGAGYAAFDGQLSRGELRHSALATPYAHVTAPLRRLVDRFALETCHALLSGREVPDWVREALPRLPAQMRDSEQRAKKYERAIIDLVEAITLRHQVGERFEGTVIQLNASTGSGVVQLAEPAVAARVSGLRKDQLGQAVIVRLVAADPASGKVEFRAIEK